MTHDPRLEILPPGYAAERVQISLPVTARGVGEGRPSVDQEMGLAQQMGHRKTQVEGRVAPVDHFVIQQHHAIGVKEDVLGL